MAAEAEFGQRPLEDLRKSEMYVRVGLEGKPESIRLLPRIRMTDTKTVNTTFDCEVEFLVEASTGNILLPQDWEDECGPPPEVYYVKAKVWPELEPDSLEQDEYRGSVQLVIDFVPPQVDSRTLTCWLLAGLDDDDPEWVATKVGLQEAKEDLRKASDLMEAIPGQRVPGAKTIAEEVAIKKKRMQVVATQKTDAERRVETLGRKLAYMQKQRDDPLNTPFTLEKVETHKPIQTCVWVLTFNNATQGARLAYLATHKYNWSDFKVAFHRFQSKPPMSTKQFWDPRLDSAFQEVNMRAVRVARRKHGRGTFKFPDDRGYYSGSWLRGLRHGMGVTLDLSGKFMGRFKRERRRGHGTHVYAHGDVVRGKYACPTRRIRASLLQGDEYCDGMLEGPAVIRFTDGSRYEGDVCRGVPHGKGVYTDTAGGRAEGHFVQGILHGSGMRAFADVTQLGHFVDGELEGQGVCIDLTLGRAEGQFTRGVLHGFADSDVTLIKGRHSGYFQDGFRTGFGELDFGNIDRDERQVAAKLKKVRQPRTPALLRHTRHRCAQRDRLHAMTAKQRAQYEERKAARAARPAHLSGRPGASDSDSVVDSDDALEERSPGQHAAAGAGGDEEDDAQVQLGRGAKSLGEYKALKEAKERRARKRRAKRQAAFNRFVRGGGGANAGAVGVGSSGEEDSGGSSSDEDVYGRAKGGLSEYDKYNDYPLPYRGDFAYEGRFRAGRVWSGGVFTARRERSAHHTHFRYFAHRFKNTPLPPELTVLPAMEARVADGRARILRNTAADAVSRRLTQEAENQRSYRYWRKIAKLNMASYRARNRAAQQGLEALKEMLLGDGAGAMWERAAGKAGVQEKHEQQEEGGVELYEPGAHGSVEEEPDEYAFDAEDVGGLDADVGGFAHDQYGDVVDEGSTTL